HRRVNVGAIRNWVGSPSKLGELAAKFGELRSKLGELVPKLGDLKSKLGELVDTATLQRYLIAFNVIRGGLGDYGIRADGVRDDDGIDGPRTREAFAAFRRMRGGSAGTDELRASVAETPAGASLGMRALAVALREWCAGVKEDPPGSNTGPRIRDYLAPCVRDGKLLRLTSGEWCAASASWCALHAKREGERLPHAYRAAGIELENDFKDAKAWRPVADVRAGKYMPRP